MQTLPGRRRADTAGLSDEALVELARGGDGEAFRAIMQRHNQRLYRVARGVVLDDIEAEDVVQEAYVRAFAALSGFRRESGLATWLTRIVLNEALGRLRRRRPTERLEALDAAAQDSRVVSLPGVTLMADPERAAAHAEIRRVVEKAIDHLPTSFRLVFILRDVHEMSVEETADQLQIKPETVKTRLHRARRLLRDRLEQRFASVLKDTFPFLGARCARITDAVLARLQERHPVQAPGATD